MLSELAAVSFPLACPEDLPAAAIQQHITTHLSAAVLGAEMESDNNEFWVVPQQNAPEDERATRFARVDANPAASLSEQLLGYAMLVSETRWPALPGGPWLEVRRIYVHPDWIGTGVAQALMDRAVQRASATGHVGLWLGTSKLNQRALAFYRRNSFLVAGERTFHVGGIANEDWVLARSLTPTL